MDSPPENVSESEDLRHLTQPNKRSKTLIDGGESSDRIPLDLIVEIFLRLPTKSIAKCRCVLKRWASILRLPLFTDLFLTKSLAQPKLLFACHKDGHVFFFSSPQPQKLGENSSLVTESCYRIKIPSELPHEISTYDDMTVSSIRGLVFLRIEGVLKGKGHVSVILNPSTGQSFTLPKVKSRRKIGVISYFGYEPIENQYKILSMTWLFYGRNRWQDTQEHQVLTLRGTGEPSWRQIECPRPHNLYADHHHVCIDGVLYYSAEKFVLEFIIVCFDLRWETFRFVTCTQQFRYAPLINYNGKLALLGREETIDGSCTSIKLLVLEDVDKQEWSEHIYALPDYWKDIVGDTVVRFVGVNQTNEIVMCSSDQYLLYYNTERNTVVRVDIKGMEAVKHSQIFTMKDHVEDVKLMCFRYEFSSFLCDCFQFDFCYRFIQLHHIVMSTNMLLENCGNLLTLNCVKIVG